MSNKQNTGGPAFPTGTGWNSQGEWVGGGEEGMTLRDYFAAKAMGAELVAGVHPSEFYEYAERAYTMADAMLKARKA